MFEIKVTVSCPDLVTAAQLLTKCAGTAAPVIPPAAPQASTLPTAQESVPCQQHTVGSPATPAVPIAPSKEVRSEAAAPAACTPGVPLAQAPAFTLAEISKAGADLIGANPGLLPKVNELLARHGIQTLDKLKPDQFGAFATALRGLGAKI